MLNSRMFRALAPVVVTAGLTAGTLLATGSSAGAAPAAAAAPGCGWTVHALPTLPGGGRGEVLGTDGGLTWVGSATDANLVQHAALWRNGRIVDLGVPLGGDSVAKDVNRLSISVGSSAATDGRAHAEMWVGSHPVQLAEPAGALDSTATGINDAGLVVGWATMPDFLGHPVVWSAIHPGAPRDLGSPAGMSTFLNGVSETGTLVGTRTDFITQDAVTGTVLTGLHVLPGTVPGALTSATAAAGRYIVGSQAVLDDQSRSGALRWTRGRPHLLPSADVSQVTAVNSAGLLAGNDFGTGGVVWQDGQEIALPSLVAGRFTAASAVAEDGTVGGASSAANGTVTAALWACG